MPIAGVSTSLFPNFNGKVNSNTGIAPNNIRPINSQANYLMDSNYGSSLVKKSKVSFTSNTEAAEQTVIKLTQEASDFFGEVLIKARDFAAKRLGLDIKALGAAADIDVDTADLEKAINYFAQKAKDAVHVGFEQILERQHGGHQKFETAAKKAGQIEHIGYESIPHQEITKNKLG